MGVQDILRRASATANGILGTTVILKRGASASEEIQVGKGQQISAGYTPDGLIVTSESLDFLIAPADYDFGDGPVEPQRGDVIVEVIDDRELRWTVTSPQGSDDKVFRQSDAFRSFLRVHTSLHADREYEEP